MTNTPTIACPGAIHATAPHWPVHESQARSIALWLLHSFTILTINADGHDLMCQFHKPADEKRMVVILPPDCYDTGSSQNRRTTWTSCGHYPTQNLQANIGAIASVQGGVAEN